MILFLSADGVRACCHDLTVIEIIIIYSRASAGFTTKNLRRKRKHNRGFHMTVFGDRNYYYYDYIVTIEYQAAVVARVRLYTVHTIIIIYLIIIMFNIYVYTVHCTTRTVVVSDKMYIVFILYSIFYVPGI